MTSREASRFGPSLAGFLLGLGLGGFLDGILLHQILQWHNMLSAVDPPTTMAAMRRNMTADGAFHAATWLCTVLGLVVLWRGFRHRTAPASGLALLGDMVFGWGVFNLVEGSIDHELLGLHHVREGAQSLSYDIAFLLLGGLGLSHWGFGLGLRPVRARDSDSGGKGGQPRRAQVQEEDRNLEQHERIVNPKIGELLFEPGKVAATTL